jgi:hypothetical protein
MISHEKIFSLVILNRQSCVPIAAHSGKITQGDTKTINFLQTVISSILSIAPGTSEHAGIFTNVMEVITLGQ